MFYFLHFLRFLRFSPPPTGKNYSLLRFPWQLTHSSTTTLTMGCKTTLKGTPTSVSPRGRLDPQGHAACPRACHSAAPQRPVSVRQGAEPVSAQPFLHPGGTLTLTAPNTSFRLPSGLSDYTPRNTGCAPLPRKAQYKVTKAMGMIRAACNAHTHTMPQAPAT